MADSLSLTAHRIARGSALVLGLTALAACGGGGGGGGGGGPVVPPPDYIELSDRAENAASTLAAFGIFTPDPGDPTIASATGELQHESGTIEITIEGVTINDTDTDADGEWATGGISLTDLPQAGQSFDYAGFYILESPSGGGPVIIGVPTEAADMPTSGSATYSGESFIQGATTFDGGSDLDSGGVASVAVDFSGAGSATITLDSFPGADGLPFDSIVISGVTISGGGLDFSSASLALLTDTPSNIEDDVLGSGFILDGDGGFFGPVGPQTGGTGPDHVGGAFGAEGANGQVFGGFLAD
ncbi:MAG: hypothetical protein ACPGID_11730 [Rubricella sp.]